MNLIAMAIPAFLALIGLEVLVAWWRGRKLYRFADSIADLSCGMVQQVVVVLFALVTVGVYKGIQAEYAWFEVPTDAWWAWGLCFLGVDFCYYWFHRLSHEVAFLWGAHVVHHQSEEYNLSVALRQSAFQPGFSWLFYLPLAWIGFPPLMFFTLAAINTLYQFWIHTRLIPRLGPLEWVFNTPSHHRVHHGRNAQYVDRNHAGTLIVWDRLFGTFEPERDEVIYGVNEALESYNPLWANFHYYASLWRWSRDFPRWIDRVKIWFMPPGWTPEGVAKPTMKPLADPKYDPPVDRAMTWYVLGQFAPMVLAVVAYLALSPRTFGWSPRLGLGLSVIGSVAVFSGLLEGRRWARAIEWVRPAIVLVLLVWLGPRAWWNAVSVTGALSAVGISAAWYGWLRSVREAAPVAVPSRGTTPSDSGIG